MYRLSEFMKGLNKKKKMPIKSKLIVSKYLSDKYKLQYGYSISKYIFNDLKNLGIWQMIFIAFKNVVFSSEWKTKEN